MVEFIAYHGSQTSKLKMYENSALYFTTNYNQAKSYAKREWDEGLIEGQIPVVYKAKLNIENPYKIKDYDDDIYKGLFSQIETFQQERG